MNKHATKNGVSVRAYKGDAMTLLAFDLTAALTKNLVGFSISYKYKVNNVLQENYIFKCTRAIFFVRNRWCQPANFIYNNFSGIAITILFNFWNDKAFNV